MIDPILALPDWREREPVVVSWQMLGPAAGKESVRFSNGHAHAHPKQKWHEAGIRQAFQASKPAWFRRPWPGPVRICWAVTTLPAANTKPDWLCLKKPDLSNIRKMLEDALNKVAFYDDAQINEAAEDKGYSSEIPLVTLRLEFGWMPLSQSKHVAKQRKLTLLQVVDPEGEWERGE